MENSAAHFKVGSQLISVGKVAVVGDCKPAFKMVDLNRLAVCTVGAAGSAVAHVSYRHVPLGQGRKDVLGENVSHQSQILVGVEKSILTDNNAAAFLTAVL